MVGRFPSFYFRRILSLFLFWINLIEEKNLAIKIRDIKDLKSSSEVGKKFNQFSLGFFKLRIFAYSDLLKIIFKKKSTIRRRVVKQVEINNLRIKLKLWVGLSPHNNFEIKSRVDTTL